MARRGRPQAHVIAGPNGSGKTTFAREFLPRHADCKQFVNADFIAQGLAPFSPETAALRAGRLMLEQIRRLVARRRDFGYETTLSGVTSVTLLRKLRADGYEIHLLSSSC
jgi:predicted ABC-type ATPase